jgi:hypothetical protein
MPAVVAGKVAHRVTQWMIILASLPLYLYEWEHLTPA